MIDVYNAVSTVYALAELEHKVGKVYGLIKWHKSDELRFCRYELHEALDHEARLLARAFRDYIAVTAAGECRHAISCANAYWTNFPTRRRERDEVYEHAHQYHPTPLLRSCVSLFNDARWRAGYGGPAWGRIAQAGLMYDKTSPLLFLDHAVDLSHNGGLFLDKGVIFYTPDPGVYQSLLNAKFNSGLLETYWVDTPVHEAVYHQLAYAMSLINLKPVRVTKVDNPEWDDEFVEWGNEIFEPDVATQDYYQDDEEDEEEDYYQDDEEDEEEDYESESSQEEEETNGIYYKTQPARD